MLLFWKAAIGLTFKRENPTLSNIARCDTMYAVIGHMCQIACTSGFLG